MDEPSDEQTGKAGSPEEGTFSQAEIDALMKGGGTTGESGDAEQGEGASSAEETGAIRQADIDALTQGGADASGPAGDAPQGKESAPPAESEAVSQNDIDALFSASDASDAGQSAVGAMSQESGASPADRQADTRVDTLGRPFDEAAAATEAAIAEERAAAQGGAPSDSGLEAEAFHLPDLGHDELAEIDSKRVTMLNDVDLRVKLQLGKTRMLVEDVLKLSEGSVVELDKLAGDPIDVLINDRLIARGEVLVLNDVFCVRISEVLSHDPHRVTT